MDVEMAGGAENENRKSPTGVCDVAQRNMAGYDVWRLKKKKDIISIKPYE